MEQHKKIDLYQITVIISPEFSISEFLPYISK